VTVECRHVYACKQAWPTQTTPAINKGSDRQRVNSAQRPRVGRPLWFCPSADAARALADHLAAAKVLNRVDNHAASNRDHQYVARYSNVAVTCRWRSDL
jgi:hypothetical protein